MSDSFDGRSRLKEACSFEDIEDRLLFLKGVLCLLKATELFGPMIEKGLGDIDFVLQHLEHLI